MTTAVVVGAGPNGLAAAIHLARNGIDVQVLEAADMIGGGARSGELTVPGVIHDHCSAAHPLGVGSPFWKEIDLGRYGLTWKWPEVDFARPLDDGTAGVLYRSIEKTVTGMGSDGRRWRLAVGDLATGFDELGQDMMRPVLHVPHHPVRLAAFGLRAMLPATVMARWFRTEQARALYGGAAAHMFTRLDRPLTAALGLMFLAGGHSYGSPVAEGGSGSIIAALAAALRAHGGAITTGVTVIDRRDIPDADIVMLDLNPAAALRIYGDAMPAWVKRSIGDIDRGHRPSRSTSPSTATSRGPTPTADEPGPSTWAARSPRSPRPNGSARGCMPQRPFVLVGQQYLADPSRSVGNINPIWSYAHVPFGYTGDATAMVVEQIERFAPGFRDRVVATVTKSTAELEAYNHNYVGGDIIGGANDRLQVVFRPRVAVDPYFTGVPGVYLCSESTPPGAGIHGLCGYHAAERALRRLRR